MAKILYRDYNFGDKTLAVIEQANSIIEDMQAQGYTLTLRQLYYQFVSRNWIPNTEREYKRLGRIISEGREAGLIDWEAIEDAGRNCFQNGYISTAEEVLRGIERRLAIDPWLDQDHYLEVWVEKQALEGVVERPAQRRRVPYMACKGYLSASEAWRAGLRFEAAIERGKQPVLLHLGDHDPSGIDMTRDNADRLELFAREGVKVIRLALNKDQIDQYNPPPNPAKLSDSRSDGYVKLHGESSWELDALAPAVIDRIISEAIDAHIDVVRWDASMAEEALRRKPLALIANRWKEVEELLDMNGEPLERAKLVDQWAASSMIQSLPRLLQESAMVVWQHDFANREMMGDAMLQNADELQTLLNRLQDHD